MATLKKGVVVCTLTGQWWEVDDPQATPQHITEQCRKVHWLPVLGPLNQNALFEHTSAAGYLRTEHVVAARWARTQP